MGTMMDMLVGFHRSFTYTCHWLYAANTDFNLCQSLTTVYIIFVFYSVYVYVLHLILTI